MVDSTFEEFARARAPHLHRAAWLLCGNQAEAEDLVQETLTKVYVRMHRLLGPRLENPAAYAQTTLTRTFISSRRKRSSSEMPYADLPDAAVRDHQTAADLRLTLAAALGNLSAMDRAVLVMRFLEDRSVEEVATLLGLSAGAVRNRSMRALSKMRDGAALDAVGNNVREIL